MCLCLCVYVFVRTCVRARALIHLEKACVRACVRALIHVDELDEATRLP